MGSSMWIVKPGENTNRGCGINVCRELGQIRNIITNSMVNGRKRTYIIQKYMERPLLYKMRKFDIRVFALVNTVNGNMTAYWYQDGYLRTSCREYNIKNEKNRLIHLTNDAVQKKSEDYGRFEQGNKVGLSLHFIPLVLKKYKEWLLILICVCDSLCFCSSRTLIFRNTWTRWITRPTLWRQLFQKWSRWWLIRSRQFLGKWTRIADTAPSKFSATISCWTKTWSPGWSKWTQTPASNCPVPTSLVSSQPCLRIRSSKLSLGQFLICWKGFFYGFSMMILYRFYSQEISQAWFNWAKCDTFLTSLDVWYQT